MFIVWCISCLLFHGVTAKRGAHKQNNEETLVSGLVFLAGGNHTSCRFMLCVTKLWFVDLHLHLIYGSATKLNSTPWILIEFLLWQFLVVVLCRKP